MRKTVLDAADVPTAQHDYTYAGDSLTEIQAKFLSDGFVFLKDEYTFHPNGIRASREFEQSNRGAGGIYIDATWDTEGRPLRRATTGFNSGNTETWSYDGGITSDYQGGGSFNTTERRTEWLTAEKPLRVFEHSFSYGNVEVHRYQTSRFTYACGSEDLMVEELDANNDGHVDGVHRVERDPAGNPLEETRSGTLSRSWMADTAPRIVYDYSCH